MQCSDSITLTKAGEYIVRGQVDIREGIVGLFEPKLPGCGNSGMENSMLGSGLVEVDDKGRIPVRIWTLQDGVRLKKGTDLGSLLVCRQIEDQELVCGISELDMEERWKILRPKFDNKLRQLPQLEAHILMPILKEFADIFSVDKNDIGLTTLVSHKIDTNEEGPIVCQHRRVPIHLEEKVEELIQEFANKGIIRASESPWNAPLVVVPKKTVT